MLWATGTISIETIQDTKAQHKAIKLPLIMKLDMSPLSTELSSWHTIFGDLSWDNLTRSYLASINNKIDDYVIHKIMDGAKEFAKALLKKAELRSVSIDPNDAHAQLEDGSESSSEEEL
jgi:hypothetical protein